jgi:hypothetical protein
MRSVLCLMTLVFSFNIFSAELDGIKFDDKVLLENKELILNGIGIRRATIFKVKVYYGGLYLDQKSKDGSIIINNNSPKQIVMNFVHDVDAKKLAGGFSDGFKAANKNAEALTTQLSKFNSLLSDVVKGDKIVINFLTDGVSVSVKGKAFEKIQSSEFSKALISIWFINPSDEGLRDGLLGLK